LKHPIKLGYTYNIKNIFNPLINLNKNFLIVDDRESNAVLLKTILQNLSIKYNCNINVEISLNGEQSIQLCKINNNNYDIIFMDINMEILDGYSTTKIIKDNGYKNIIIATTGDENVQTIKNDYIYFDDILIKPFDESNLVNILSKFI
jgi:CheY-like chemotaxis protein